MRRPLWADHFRAQYALISIRDLGTTDNPVAGTGEEEVVFSPGKVYVATRPDVDGDVRVELWAEEPDALRGREVLNAVMEFESGIVCVADPVDPDGETVRLPRAGRWRTRVRVQGEPRPHTVSVFLRQEDGGHSA
ncbi:hypothetical protein [Streptomyces fragilis]|uniref:Uncharacterized protein n=1 Tax=Streptomyces fragilis TaxID=67301 RepID=A0ABV2YDI1_9ACTN|nr:hypothetical protein [Streptomyces fragilis]